MRFLGRVAIITGGAGGIGLATARKFASEGAHIVVADLDQARLDQAAAIIKGNGAVEVWPAVCNVSDEAQVATTVKGALDKFGRLDVIVNNAGLMIYKPIEELGGEEWQRIFSVDLLGAFFFTKQAFLHMRPGGAIVNVSSIHAEETEILVSAYAAAKAGLVSLTRSAALEGKPKGIRVNAILPGAVDTPMLWQNPNVKSGEEQINEKDVGSPDDIAAVIAFLASDEARFVQGASLIVDGGRLAKL
jgi:NAD(P)-dependent dehydrogenase (short-subunit alcohol dehydrogenase family)